MVRLELANLVMVLFTSMGMLLTASTLDYHMYKMGNSIKFIIELLVILSNISH